mmetsp:Transcript_3266/g.7783  ORF Transcript_3266/g.7783 Transcript_3266/m.7783 type:complete len:223 (-) Transcript_3266:2691-3359(-)
MHVSGTLKTSSASQCAGAVAFEAAIPTDRASRRTAMALSAAETTFDGRAIRPAPASKSYTTFRASTTLTQALSNSGHAASPRTLSPTRLLSSRQLSGSVSFEASKPSTACFAAISEATWSSNNRAAGRETPCDRSANSGRGKGGPSGLDTGISISLAGIQSSSPPRSPTTTPGGSSIYNRPTWPSSPEASKSLQSSTRSACALSAILDSASRTGSSEESGKL